MKKATIEQIKRMFNFGALGWDRKLEDTKEVVYFYSASIFFPSESSSEEQERGLVELIDSIIGGHYEAQQTRTPFFSEKGHQREFKYKNLDEESPILDLELKTFQFTSEGRTLYDLDCGINVKERDEKWHESLFEKVAQFVHKYGNVEAPKPKPKPDPIVPYEGREIDIEAEVAKIDIGKLREEYEGECLSGRFLNEKNRGMGIYLAETGRLRPDNAIMIMTYEGNGLFTIIGEWEDVDIDPRTDLIRRNSHGKNLEYIQVDYEKGGVSLSSIFALDGQEVDEDVTNAVLAYTTVSGIIAQHGKFNAFEIKEDARPEIKSMFPQKLLDFSQTDDNVREQLVEYLIG